MIHREVHCNNVLTMILRFDVLYQTTIFLLILAL